MSKINFINNQQINCLEDYISACLISMASLQTLGGYQLVASETGLLEEDEFKTSEVILANIKALLIVYRSQVENLLDRTQITEQEILSEVQKHVPRLQIPKKRNNSRNKKNEIPPVS
jgi:hypothetical protein